MTVVVCKRKADGMYYLNGKREKNKDYETVHTTKEIDNWITMPTKKSKNMDATPKKKISMDLNEAHDKYRHKSEAILRKTLQVADIQPTGTLTNCEGCNLTKAKQKGVSKTTTK